MVYKYESPASKGYVLTKLKRRHLNKVLKYPIQPHWRVDVWWKEEDNTFIVERCTAYWAVFANCVLLPITLLLHGVANYKEILQEHKDLFNEKEKGKFVSDYWRGDFASKLREMM